MRSDRFPRAPCRTGHPRAPPPPQICPSLYRSRTGSQSERSPCVSGRGALPLLSHPARQGPGAAWVTERPGGQRTEGRVSWTWG